MQTFMIVFVNKNKENVYGLLMNNKHVPIAIEQDFSMYEGHSESKVHFALPYYSLIIIIIQKLNIQVLANTFLYYST